MTPKTADQINLPQVGSIAVEEAQKIVTGGPRVSTGKGSKQDYETPWELIRAVERKFGPMATDLAATLTNKKAPEYIGDGRSSLTEHWHTRLGNLWLNPPFSDIAPWAKKCVFEMELGAKIFFLVPASVGSNWFADYVHRKALVLFLSPRISFDGANPYPKDIILACYGQSPGYECWRWK